MFDPIEVLLWLATLLLFAYLLSDGLCRLLKGMGLAPLVRGFRKGYPAWHFLSTDGRLRFSDNREVKVGETLTVKGQPELCRYGMHASHSIFDSLKFAPGPILTRVLVKDGVCLGTDKLVGKSRTCLAIYPDLSPVFLEWAYWVCQNKWCRKYDLPYIVKALDEIRKLMDEPDPQARELMFDHALEATHGSFSLNWMLNRMAWVLRSPNNVSEDNWRDFFREAREISSWLQKRRLVKMLREAGAKDL